MGMLDRIEIAARIAKLGSEAYGILIDKALAKANTDKDRKIAALEAELKELRSKP